MSAIPLRWSTDLVTFFRPENWGLPHDLPYERWEAEVSAEPRRFFDRMLDGAAEAGLSGVELAPSPGGWVNALRAYGSTDGFRDALLARGLVVSSSYVLPTWLARILDAADSTERDRAIAGATDEFARHATFLRELGCSVLVTSTLARASFPAGADADAVTAAFARPVEDDVIDSVAELLDTVAAGPAADGVRVAIHTDAYSLCARPQDVDRLMAQTDPGRVCLCIDAGHIALDGADPLVLLRRHADRAPVLHWKDCAAPLPAGTLTGTPMQRHDDMIRSFRLIGDGILDWHAWTDILRAESWSGWAVAELDMSADPVGEIRAARGYYERELAGR